MTAALCVSLSHEQRLGACTLHLSFCHACTCQHDSSNAHIWFLQLHMSAVITARDYGRP